MSKITREAPAEAGVSRAGLLPLSA